MDWTSKQARFLQFFIRLCQPPRQRGSPRPPGPVNHQTKQHPFLTFTRISLNFIEYVYLFTLARFFFGCIFMASRRMTHECLCQSMDLFDNGCKRHVSLSKYKSTLLSSKFVLFGWKRYVFVQYFIFITFLLKV